MINGKRFLISILSVFFLLASVLVSAQEPTVVSLWIFEGEEGFLPALEEAFEAEYPNIDLQITEFPEDQYVTKIDTALLAGEPPDIAFVYEPRWMKAGYFLPLEETIAEYEIDLSTFNQSIIETACSYEGTLYCIGSYNGAVVLFYNKDLFDAAGLDYLSTTEPITIDEWAEIGAALTQPSDDPAEATWGTDVATTMWWSDPALHFSEDGFTTEGIVNSETMAHFYEVMAQMVEDGIAPTPGALDALGIGPEDIFAQGRLGMVIGDNLYAAGLFEAQGMNYGVAPVPQPEGIEAWVASWTDQFGVFASSNVAEEALTFIGFLGTEGNRLRVEVSGTMPLDSAVAIELDWAGENPQRQEMLEVVSTARPGIFVPGFWDVTEPLWDVLFFMIEDGMSAQEALDEAAVEMQRRLDESWETWNSIETGN